MCDTETRTRLARIETKIDLLIETREDHETRLREVEEESSLNSQTLQAQRRGLWAVATASIGAVVGVVFEFLGKI